MDLDLRLVRAFVAVAEEEHVGRAAERLYLSQPGLTKQIRRLEGVLGVRLVERQGRGIRLTPAGEAFVVEARSLLRRAERAVAAARRAARAHGGEVLVGFVPPIPGPVSVRLAELDVPLELRRVDWHRRGELLGGGEIDLCLLPLPIGPGPFRHIVLWREPRVAGFPTRHRLAGRSELSIDELAEEPIVDLPTHREYWCVDPRPDGRSPRYGPLVHSVEEMLEVVSQGRAMCITSASVAEFYRPPGVVFVPILDIAPAEFAVVWHPDHLTDAAAELRRRLAPSPETS